MSNPRALRVAGWSGILFSLLSLVVVPLVASPSSTPPPVLGATAEDHGARGDLLAARSCLSANAPA